MRVILVLLILILYKQDLTLSVTFIVNHFEDVDDADYNCNGSPQEGDRCCLRDAIKSMLSLTSGSDIVMELLHGVHRPLFGIDMTTVSEPRLYRSRNWELDIR
mgnify:CR=1 FL=1